MTESKSCASKKVQGGGFIGTRISIFINDDLYKNGIFTDDKNKIAIFIEK